MDPTISVGGILKAIGGNIRVGNSEIFVTEACEYTNSFLSFFPKISVILNIDEDHLDFFKDLEDIRNSFHRFAKLIPKDGTLVINGDIDRLDEITGDLDCKIVTYGTNPSATYHRSCCCFSVSSGNCDWNVVVCHKLSEKFSTCQHRESF